MDAFLDRSDIKPVFEKYFIPVKLVVQESEKNAYQKAAKSEGKDLSTWVREVLNRALQ